MAEVDQPTLEQQQALAMMAMRARAAQAQDNSPAGIQAQAEAVEKPSALNKIGMGLADQGLGLVQNMARMPIGGDAPVPQPDAGMTQRAGDQIDTLLHNREQDWQARRQASGDTGVEWLRSLGNGIGSAPIAAMMPGGPSRSVLGAIGRGVLEGGALSTNSPVTDTEGDFASAKAKQIGLNAGIGGVMKGGFHVAGNAINPNVDPNIRYLRDRGVNPTLGQNIGPGAATVEDVAKTVNPMVALGQRRAIREFNVAAYNQVLNPLGEQFQGEPGRDAVRVVGDRLSQAYNDLVPHLRLEPDEQMMADLSQAMLHRNIMSEQASHQFDNILENTMPRGPLAGEPLQRLQSKLTLEIRRFGRSPDPNHQMIADGLADVRTAITDNLARVNPEQAERLTAIDRGWANLVRLEHAATNSNDNGIFTPTQLLQASRATEDSVRRRAIARGMGGDMQQLADAGVQVLGNRYPNSGTATRAAVLGAPALAATAAASPGVAGSIVGTSLAYTPWGQRLAGSVINGNRGAFAPQIANGARRLGTAATATGLPAISSMIYGMTQ